MITTSVELQRKTVTLPENKTKLAPDLPYCLRRRLVRPRRPPSTQTLVREPYNNTASSSRQTFFPRSSTKVTDEVRVPDSPEHNSLVLPTFLPRPGRRRRRTKRDCACALRSRCYDPKVESSCVKIATRLRGSVMDISDTCALSQFRPDTWA